MKAVSVVYVTAIFITTLI